MNEIVDVQYNVIKGVWIGLRLLFSLFLECRKRVFWLRWFVFVEEGVINCLTGRI